VNGTWRAAIQVLGTATLNQGGEAQVQSVSCPSGGNCGAGGGYTDSSGHRQAFVVSESRRRARERCSCNRLTTGRGVARLP
jgi:hypothetical protein